MSSIIINANNITNTTTNSTFQVDFDRTINLNDKHISLTCGLLKIVSIIRLSSFVLSLL